MEPMRRQLLRSVTRSVVCTREILGVFILTAMQVMVLRSSPHTYSRLRIIRLLGVSEIGRRYLGKGVIVVVINWVLADYDGPDFSTDGADRKVVS